MECMKLLECRERIGHSGVCIGMENSQVLKNALIILQKENHFRKSFYWGRINGLNNDYHIAFGYQEDCLKDQTFFYSLDGLEWLLLPKSNECSKFLMPLATTLLEGNPSVVMNVYNTNPPFPPDEDASEFFQGPVPQYLKEEDRLSAIVEVITAESMLIPRGAWYKHPDGSIRENIAFEGLDRLESVQLKSYLHARLPQEKWRRNLLTREDYNYSFDFLDTADGDIPNECWTMEKYLAGKLLILQNLYWPGMTFYHMIESPHYGSLYVGNGIKNLNVPFMI